MRQKNMGFFKRVKNAIMNFDEYKNFSEEKLWITIKYILKLVFVFSLVITFLLTYKATEEIDKAIQIYKEECPEFKFENNTLIIDSEKKQFIKGDENGYFGILIDSEKENINEIQETANYQIAVGILKDKIVIRNYEGIESSITYEQISNRYDISGLNKEEILKFISGNEMIRIYASFIIISLIYLYAAYLIQILLDVLLLSVVGYLLSKIVGVKFKYKSIFNMSAYSLTLSIILYMIYISINLFTGFTIKYFEIAYNAIAYIYIITAMLMMKSDLIKQQIEVERIVEEQKKIKEEKEQEQDKKEEDKKQDKDKQDKEKKEKKKKGDEREPEGNEA